MKVLQLTFKTPDVVHEALEEARLTSAEAKKAKEICKKFVKWDEYITINIDIEKGTAEVAVIN